MNKFFRTKSKYLAGVCGGLGEHTGIDPIIYRILFILIPYGTFIYLAIWLFSKQED